MDERMLDLLQSLYAAPGTAAGWQAFLEQLRVMVHGSAASILVEDLHSQDCAVRMSTFDDPEGHRQYNEHWGAVDPWAHSPNRGLLASRPVIVGDALIGHRDVQRTAYYADYARHYDLVRALVGVLDATPAALSVVSVSGSELRGPFGERDVALLELLAPHIGRALQLHRQLTAANQVAGDFASALDLLSPAVLLVDAAGRVVFMNRAASALLERRDGLTVERGELRAARAADTSRLRSAIADAVRLFEGSVSCTRGRFAIGRPSGSRPLAVLVSPVSPQRTVLPTGGLAAAIVCVTDPEDVVVPDEPTLKALFGLTRAEARLTQLLVQGRSVHEAGAELGITRETARSRLKIIFRKTNTHRQAELIRVAMSGVPRL